MAARTQNDSREDMRRQSEADSHPTPLSSYFGLAIMVVIALFMIVLQANAGPSI